MLNTIFCKQFLSTLQSEHASTLKHFNTLKIPQFYHCTAISKYLFSKYGMHFSGAQLSEFFVILLWLLDFSTLTFDVFKVPEVPKKAVPEEKVPVAVPKKKEPPSAKGTKFRSG